MKITGNTVLITGGAMGIGYALAEAFLEARNEVLICGRREQRLLEAQKKHPEFHIRICDIGIEADRQSLVAWVGERHPKLNVLVNNAGIQRNVDFTQGIEDYRSGANEVAINLEAPIVLSGMLIPQLMKKAGSAIVNVSSGLAFLPSALMPVYSATKSGLHAFSIALRYQLRKQGIKVFELVPPALDTELNLEGRSKRVGFNAELKPKEFVNTVMEGLRQDIWEIGYAMTETVMRASRVELDNGAERLNSGF